MKNTSKILNNTLEHQEKTQGQYRIELASIDALCDIKEKEAKKISRRSFFKKLFGK